MNKIDFIEATTPEPMIQFLLIKYITNQMTNQEKKLCSQEIIKIKKTLKY